MSTAAILTVVAAVASGLVGGIFFAFSTFVVQGLDRGGAAVGITAMQGINVTALNPPFMALLFGGPLVGIAAAVAARGSAELHPGWTIAGAVALALPALMTIAFHVPRNIALDALDPEADGSDAAWSAFVRGWVAGNHVRTLGGAAAALAFTLALVA